LGDCDGIDKKMATPTPTLAEKLDKIKSPGLQSQQKVKEYKQEREKESLGDFCY
jgi:hypothetical protein